MIYLVCLPSKVGDPPKRFGGSAKSNTAATVTMPYQFNTFPEQPGYHGPREPLRSAIAVAGRDADSRPNPPRFPIETTRRRDASPGRAFKGLKFVKLRLGNQPITSLECSDVYRYAPTEYGLQIPPLKEAGSFVGGIVPTASSEPAKVVLHEATAIYQQKTNETEMHKQCIVMK